MDLIKQAFDKVKQQIESLKQQIESLKQQIESLKQQIESLKQQKITLQYPNTNKDIFHWKSGIPTHIPTHQHYVEPLKSPNMAISIGNGGVPTNKPTNQPTHQQTNTLTQKIIKISKNRHFPDDFQKASEILESLDSIKKEIRLKFKRLTTQEMQVFSRIYALQEQNIDEINHRIIAQELNLSESSIRDYVNKIIKKGIPLLKIRENNKKISLKISPDIQKIASLSTIIKLRDL